MLLHGYDRSGTALLRNRTSGEKPVNLFTSLSSEGHANKKLNELLSTSATVTILARWSSHVHDEVGLRGRLEQKSPARNNCRLLQTAERNAYPMQREYRIQDWGWLRGKPTPLFATSTRTRKGHVLGLLHYFASQTKGHATQRGCNTAYSK